MGALSNSSDVEWREVDCMEERERCRLDMTETLGERRKATYHAPKSFLTRCVPQLEPDFQPVPVDLLRDEKCSGRGSRVLGVEFVLGISLQQAGLPHT